MSYVPIYQTVCLVFQFTKQNVLCSNLPNGIHVLCSNLPNGVSYVPINQTVCLMSNFIERIRSRNISFDTHIDIHQLLSDLLVKSKGNISYLCIFYHFAFTYLTTL